MMMQNEYFNQEVEMFVLGLILTHHSLTERILDLCVDDFYYTETQRTAEIIRHEYLENKDNFDKEILGKIVTQMPEKVTPVFLARIDECWDSQAFDIYWARLKEMAFNRRIKARIKDLAVSPAPVRLEQVRQIVDDESEHLNVVSYADKSRQSLDSFIEGVGVQKERIRFGFPFLDRLTGGLRLPSVSIIGAAPSVGKTAFALNVAIKQRLPVVIFSLEMSCDMIYERLISAGLQIDYGLFSRQKFSDDQKKEIARYARELRGRDIYVFDTAYSVEEQSLIIANIRPGLVVVDYIQKVRTVQKIDNRRNEIDYISGQYKRLANFNKCHVMLLSQITRVDRAMPNMASLKESGALEADGDYVCILHRPYVLKKDDDSIRPEEAYILVDKNKFGNTGKLDLRFSGVFQQFSEVDRRYGSEDDGLPF